jgi:hypothetical protein
VFSLSSVNLAGGQSSGAVRVVGREDNGGFLGRELLNGSKGGLRDRRIVGDAVRFLGPEIGLIVDRVSGQEVSDVLSADDD